MSFEHFTRDETPGRQCKSVMELVPLCIIDIVTIVVVVLFIWSVIWGAPMTIRFVKRCASKRNASRCKKISPFHIDTEKDCSSNDRKKGADWDLDYTHDPYLSPSQKLFNFLRGDAPPVPHPVFSPVKTSDESAICKSGEDSSFVFFSLTPTKSASSSVSSLESFDYSSNPNSVITSTPFSGRDRTGGLGTSLSFSTPLPCRPPATLGRGATVGRASCKPCTW